MGQIWARETETCADSERCGPVWTRREWQQQIVIALYLRKDVSIQYVVKLSLLYSPAEYISRESLSTNYKALPRSTNTFPFLGDLCCSCLIRSYLSIDWNISHLSVAKITDTQHKYSPLPLSHSVTLSLLQDATGSMILGAWISRSNPWSGSEQRKVHPAVCLAHLPTGKAALSANGVRVHCACLGLQGGVLQETG